MARWLVLGARAAGQDTFFKWGIPPWLCPFAQTRTSRSSSRRGLRQRASSQPYQRDRQYKLATSAHRLVAVKLRLRQWRRDHVLATATAPARAHFPARLRLGTPARATRAHQRAPRLETRATDTRDPSRPSSAMEDIETTAAIGREVGVEAGAGMNGGV
jgi:hypothetical protein